jgi:hypothetical protein
MNTIYAINADRQERIETVEKSQLSKRIKMLQNQGWLQVKVIA